jgi:hypothetical protein
MIRQLWTGRSIRARQRRRARSATTAPFKKKTIERGFFYSDNFKKLDFIFPNSNVRWYLRNDRTLRQLGNSPSLIFLNWFDFVLKKHLIENPPSQIRIMLDLE